MLRHCGDDACLSTPFGKVGAERNCGPVEAGKVLGGYGVKDTGSAGFTVTEGGVGSKVGSKATESGAPWLDGGNGRSAAERFRNGGSGGSTETEGGASWSCCVETNGDDGAGPAARKGGKVPKEDMLTITGQAPNAALATTQRT